MVLSSENDVIAYLKNSVSWSAQRRLANKTFAKVEYNKNFT